ncbi:type IV toxin-antitoxin system AbiEi family antitoxin domain-containing protein [Candidatus Protochlamydia amoebophila]|uniref:type IV toxin-antitoxin system AbiEi family antitoxin domain-containing protein n=1 Tax=Candidatus Protochlamydia amoebophila TaxID=362787 RepID=UPI001BC9ECE2|nr:type IV toxin-antitoxin system AbiEi family antitoxin domain-containing protein [Candidatus Protochlamydia amoebophila]
MDKNVVKSQYLSTLLSMTAKQKAIKHFKKNQGLLRTAEAMRLGIHPRIIYQLRDEGLLEQLAKGVYRLVEVPDFSEPDLVLVSKKIPQAVICLISALAYHEITTQIPHFVYIAIPTKSRQSSLNYPPIRYFHYSEKVYNAGLETTLIGGYPVKIYNIEKTLADCLKFRNKIGMDVVIEALKMYWQRKGTQIDKLYEYAKINRVEKILQPIMETIVSQ